jgi:hypothetical protein
MFPYRPQRTYRYVVSMCWLPVQRCTRQYVRLTGFVDEPDDWASMNNVVVSPKFERGSNTDSIESDATM